MKRARWLIPCLIVALALGTVGCAQRDGQVTIPVSVQQNTGVWVTGQGEVMAIPDIATLSLGIEAQKDTVAEAQAQANEAMDNVMETLKDNGIDEKDIQTQRFSIYPVTTWLEREDKEEIIGYRVTNMVTAKIRNIDEADVVIDAVVEAGGDYIRIQGINFDIADPTPYYEEARDKAIEDAKNKAGHLADLTGVKLGKPTYVSEDAVYSPYITRVSYDVGMAVPAAPETSISPGELKLTINVQVAYAIA